MGGRNIISRIVKANMEKPANWNLGVNAHWIALIMAVMATSLLLAISVDAHDWLMGACSLVVGVLLFLEAEVLLFLTAHPQRKEHDRKAASWICILVAGVTAAAIVVFTIWPF